MKNLITLLVLMQSLKEDGHTYEEFEQTLITVGATEEELELIRKTWNEMDDTTADEDISSEPPTIH